jgi:hypothetical protein
MVSAIVPFLDEEMAIGQVVTAVQAQGKAGQSISRALFASNLSCDARKLANNKSVGFSARDVEEPADKVLPVTHGGHFAAQPGIEAETAAGTFERK